MIKTFPFWEYVVESGGIPGFVERPVARRIC